RLLAERASAPQNFTIRALLVGLLIGVLICFSNMYFGLQTGWVSGMAMPSALIGFAFFKALRPLLRLPFTPVENVLVQTVAGSVGTMPLGSGFVAVIPALEYLLKPEEGGPLRISTWKLFIWAIGVAFFGVLFAVPLRREVIIREKLKFPSGTATALMIGVLHGEEKGSMIKQDAEDEDETRALIQDMQGSTLDATASGETDGPDDRSDWMAKVKLLVIAFSASGLYTLLTYFIPQLRDIPFLGPTLAYDWLWTINPSPAYIGQGIIMGPATTLHMLLGALVGWGMLSPLAKYKGWAPGPVSDWTEGSKGWIVWISLAIMIADSLINLGWLIVRPLVFYGWAHAPELRQSLKSHSWKEIMTLKIDLSKGSYDTVPDTPSAPFSKQPPDEEEADADAPPEHLISFRTAGIGLILSLILCTITTQYAFDSIVPLPLTLFALVLALVLSIMGVRALGETDLNPVSGISKLTQLLFALVTPRSNPNAVVINLIAGAISESGALQAGDLMQDLKTGHLLGASPAAQFWGQIIGCAVGALLSALIYRLYTSVYTIPGGMFQVPTGFVWVFTARLVTGQGLPPKVAEWALGAGGLWVVFTIIRVFGNSRHAKWVAWVPGGIAVAVGMYNVPSFTLARTIGGMLHWYWCSYKKRQETPVIVLASGLILGEGVFSIVNLVLASLDVPHL
ncbi:oligopeptide transporter-like protein, partial [Rhizodiscina lignyota]